MSRAERLAAHVAAVSDTPCIWGASDCSRWVGDWVEAETGNRLGLPAYRNEAQGRALIAARGGLLALWMAVASRAGLPETGLPQLGDVGLVETRLGPVGVIVAHGGICALRTQASVTFLRPRAFLRAWMIP